MAFLLNTSKNHLLCHSNRAFCTAFKKTSGFFAAPTLTSQLHCLPPSVNSSSNTSNPLGKHTSTVLSVKGSSIKSKSSHLPVKNCRNFSSGSSIPSSIWNLGRLNHIAIAVPDLEKATAFYRDVLQARVSAAQHLPEHGVTTVFVELDNTKLELLLPLGEKSPIQKFLDKNKSGGLHHVCLEVDAIEEAVAAVKKAGVRCLSPSTRIGAHGKPVMFLHPADCGGVLLELEQA